MEKDWIRENPWCAQKDWVWPIFGSIFKWIKSKSKAIIGKDWDQVLNPNSIIDIYWTIADLEQEVREAQEQEPNLKKTQKSVDSNS